MRLTLSPRIASTALLASPAEASQLPDARQLAALGSVLCLHRAHAGSELDGWLQAVRATSESALDSDGLYERLEFLDADGHCCWRLYLLPDTDFLAWERLVAGLPGERELRGGIGERLWRRVFRYLGDSAWRASVLRFHALPTGRGDVVLAASPPALSACGTEVARRIIRREGVDDAALAEPRPRPSRVLQPSA
ncbi:MAG: Hemin transport protein [Thermomonas sp.]|uniref:Hemin transport protein n=1 Tax=Thermomonas sp. TaxID=1971895 RepID=UPI0039E4B85F